MNKEPQPSDAPPEGRKRPSHQPVFEIGFRSSIIFLTVCAQDRKPILASENVHNLLIQTWRDSEQWSVGCYVIMPDHIHLFCAPKNRDSEPLRSWVKYWKSNTSIHWPIPAEQPIWQRDVWDRQLRRGQSYSEKWLYVRDNPVRAGLVENHETWPFQGELSIFQWHDT